MPPIRLWLLMVLPFALWGSAMTAMAPLLESGGSWWVAALRLLPAGALLIVWTVLTGRSWRIDPRDLGWFLLFTAVDACLFQALLARGLAGTGAGLGSVLIDSQPLLVALLARLLFADSINPSAGLDWLWGRPAFSASACLQTSWGIGGFCWIRLRSASFSNPARGGCCLRLWPWPWARC